MRVAQRDDAIDITVLSEHPKATCFLLLTTTARESLNNAIY